MVESSVNSSNNHSNLSDNCYWSLSIEERILKTIDESEIELKPIEIAKKIHANASSVRVILRKLLDKGMILQPYEGSYCNKITHGMRFVPRMVHNIRLSSNLCQNVKHDVVDERTGGVGVHVVFGEERRKVSGWIKCDAGMVYDSCMFALNRWFDIVEGKLGFAVNDLKLTCFEVNKDYHGVRVEGVQCLTRSGLFGMIERFYQKENNILRHEWKVTTPTSINEFDATLRSGLDNAQKSQASFETAERIARLAEAQKYTNSRLLNVERLLEALVKNVIAEKEGGGSAKPLNREGDYSF